MNHSLTRESTIVSLVDAPSLLYPDKTALVFEHTSFTFGQLQLRSNQLAHFLKQQGDLRDVPLCFCLEPSLEKVVVMLGIWKAGGAYVSLDPLYPEHRLRHILEDTASPVLITTRNLAGKFPFWEGPLLLIDEQADEIDRMPAYAPESQAVQGLAYLAYTSGSTGVPKAVMAEHKGLANFVAQFGIFLGAGPEDTALNISSSNFDGIVLDLWVPLSLGMTVYLYRDNRIVGDALLQYIRQHEITVLPYLPVSILATLPDNEPAGILRKICTGGEAPVAAVIEAWRPKVELINIYGPTETTVVVSGFEFDDLHPLGTIGKPLPNVDFYVLNEGMEPVPGGETGELYIGGVQVSRGYYKRPDLTAERFVAYTAPDGSEHRVYRTGDLVKRLEDDTVVFVGRADQQVKIRGFRVEPSEIEAHILQSGLVANCIVVPVGSGSEKQLICYYKTASGYDTYADDIRAWLLERMPVYMVPSRFLDIPEFPLTANGKIDKGALAELQTDGEKRRAYAAPVTLLQQDIARLWCRILKLPVIGIHDNFFQFGGNSVLAYKLLTLMRRELHLSLEIADLFACPTIHTIESNLKELKQQAESVTVSDEMWKVPLSAQQESLWFIDRLRGSSAYNVGVNIPLSGALPVEGLVNAVRQLIYRHKILRSVIKEEDGVAYHVPLQADNWLPQELYDYEKIGEAVRMPFDLKRDYMLRAYTVHEAGRPVSLLLVLHHIVVDGWSVPLIINELNALCSDRSGKIPAEDGRAVPEYGHYVHRSLQAVQDTGINFWKTYLEEVPVLQLTSVKNSLVGAEEAMQYRMEVAAPLVAGLKELSEAYGATLYMTLLSGFGLLMQYFSGQQDICIGTAAANRPPAFDATIGYFANMLPVRLQIDGNPVFADFLKYVRDMMPGVFRHQDTPLDTIIHHVLKDRFAGHNPLFQTVFVLQNPLDSEEEGPLQAQYAEWIFNGYAKFDLQFEIIPSGDTLILNVDYNTALFDSSVIEKMATTFLFILRSVVSDPLQHIGAIPLHSVFPSLLEELPEPVNEPELLVHLFEKQVAETPGKTALVLGGERISYGYLNELADRVASVLITSGVGRGHFVACYQEQSFNRVVTLLAILKAGAAYVPLDVSYPQERIDTILKDTCPQLIVAAVKFAGLAARVAVPVMKVEEMLEAASVVFSNYSSTHSGDDYAYVIHTSGTTGTPKGVLIGHRALGNFITEYGTLLDIRVDDQTLQFSPYNFDGSVIDLWIPLTRGATVHLYPNNKLLGSHLAEFISLNAVTVIPFMAPSVLSTLAHTIELPAVRTIGTGAESCPAVVSDYWKHRVKLVNMYGPTETTVAVNEHIFSDHYRDNTIGKPIRNMRWYVLDTYLRPVPEGVVGELYLSGIQLSVGYLNQPGLTAERFVDNPFVTDVTSIYSRMYRTGDQARVLPEGLLEYMGRTDHQVKIRGYRIEPAEIERALCSLAGITGAVVQVVGSQETMVTLRAFVTGDAAVTDIRLALGRKLPSYMIPRAIHVIDHIPVKANGKLDMELLSLVAESAGKEEGPEEVPANEYERSVKEVWAEVLQCRINSLEEDFFQLGGHSLLLTRLYNKLFQRFPNKISLSELYVNSTIRKLAALIAEREANPQLHHYGLGMDPLSDEIRKDATVAADAFRFEVMEYGDFAHPKAILLTGVTGFVGLNMLVEFLHSSSAVIYLLIRAENEEHAERRLLHAMDDQLIDRSVYDPGRVRLLAGDLARPFLGLDPEVYEQLTRDIDVVHHAGSAVNFIQPYAYMKAANVDALHTLIRFVTTNRLKRLSLLSTVGVFSWEHYFTKPELMMEHADTTSAFKYLSRDMGYIQSKWVMEQVALEAIRQGVPIVIFRLGYVFCHSLTGATAKYQWWGLLIKTCVQLKAYPLLMNQKEELVMVDFVSRAVAYIAAQPDAAGEVFHVSPEPKHNITVTAFFEILREEFGMDLSPLPYQEWMKLWEEDEDSPLYPLLNLFKFVAYDGKSIIEIHQNTPDFDISNTNKFLKNSNIENFTVSREIVAAFCKYLGVL